VHPLRQRGRLAASPKELPGWPWLKALLPPAGGSEVEPVYFWGRALPGAAGRWRRSVAVCRQRSAQRVSKGRTA